MDELIITTFTTIPLCQLLLDNISIMFANISFTHCSVLVFLIAYIRTSELRNVGHLVI